MKHTGKLVVTWFESQFTPSVSAEGNLFSEIYEICSFWCAISV